jgi:hypothetical protein
MNDHARVQPAQADGGQGDQVGRPQALRHRGEPLAAARGHAVAKGRPTRPPPAQRVGDGSKPPPTALEGWRAPGRSTYVDADEPAPHVARSEGDRRHMDGCPGRRRAQDHAAVRAQVVLDDHAVRARGRGDPGGVRGAVPGSAGVRSRGFWIPSGEIQRAPRGTLGTRGGSGFDGGPGDRGSGFFTKAGPAF